MPFLALSEGEYSPCWVFHKSREFQVHLAQLDRLRRFYRWRELRFPYGYSTRDSPYEHMVVWAMSENIPHSPEVAKMPALPDALLAMIENLSDIFANLNKGHRANLEIGIIDTIFTIMYQEVETRHQYLRGAMVTFAETREVADFQQELDEALNSLPLFNTILERAKATVKLRESKGETPAKHFIQSMKNFKEVIAAAEVQLSA